MRQLELVLASALTFTLLALDAAPSSSAEYPWPGFLAGGQFFRDPEWGVSFYGPAQADIERLPTRGTLVQYSVQARGDQPAWIIKVVASKVSSELGAAEQLAASADQLKKAYGPRVSNVQTQAAPAGSPILGRLTCQIATGESGGGPVECRSYLYCRLREKQYLTFVGSTTQAGQVTIEQVLQSLGRSLRIFDPKAEGERLEAAQRRTADLLARTTPEQFHALAVRFPETWFRIYNMAPAPPAADGQPAPQPRPEQVGWGYMVIVAGQGPGQIEAVTSLRLGQPGQPMLRRYQSFYADLADGKEINREWNRTDMPARPGSPAESAERMLVARRQGDKFDVTESVTGQQPGSYTVKITGQPYVPPALLGLLPQMNRGADADTMWGGFSFSTSPGQRATPFGTLRLVARSKVQVGSQQVDALRWFSRETTSSPTAVRWTDPTGTQVLRLELSPYEWADACGVAEVPPDVARELKTKPNWP
ncbi:MAG: hypothetical protein BIFFINMI_03414 [Phycisphaerae bacterium]|nr:hypothetical protein [Phycisphaerae bacterium]